MTSNTQLLFSLTSKQAHPVQYSCKAPAVSKSIMTCPVGACKRTYTNDGSLRNHLRTVHSDRYMLPKSPRARGQSLRARSSLGNCALSQGHGPEHSYSSKPWQPPVGSCSQLLNSQSSPDLWMHNSSESACSSPLTVRPHETASRMALGEEYFSNDNHNNYNYGGNWPTTYMIGSSPSIRLHSRQNSCDQLQVTRKSSSPLTRQSLKRCESNPAVESATRRLQALADISVRIAEHAEQVMQELRACNRSPSPDNMAPLASTASLPSLPFHQQGPTMYIDAPGPAPLLEMDAEDVESALSSVITSPVSAMESYGSPDLYKLRATLSAPSCTGSSDTLAAALDMLLMSSPECPRAAPDTRVSACTSFSYDDWQLLLSATAEPVASDITVIKGLAEGLRLDC